jgi:hypothetical protein
MGMFDSVIEHCECGGQFEWQSKAGLCTLATFSVSTAPDVVALDLNDTTASCDRCGVSATIHTHVCVDYHADQPDYKYLSNRDPGDENS